ncbi:MAG TPA: M48 family metallopeptidase [Sedimentisphaerales bacterium]|nr:M48 family metallopeptidase [Sedimentisphaerales bacterium]
MCGKFTLLILGLIYCLCTGCAINPITGDEELMFIGEEQDIEIGKHYAPEVEKQMGGRINKNDLQEYIDSVGQRIARVSQKPNLEYHFVALNHKSVNAFALPGGYIFVTRGMLENLETEAQLAAVLAHEIVHVVARDTANTMSKEIGINMLMVGAAVVSRASGEVMTSAQVAHMIVGLQYSKQDERQADLGGLKYMVRAGYDPQGMVETMEMFEARERDTRDDFLSSHPSPINRVGYLKQRIHIRYSNLTDLKVGKEDYEKSVLGRLPKRPL